MRTRSSSNLIVESFTILKRRNCRRSKQIVKPELRTIEEIPVATMADTRTMSELLQAHTKGYEDAIVIPAIFAENFELKVSGNLLNCTPRDALTIIKNNSKVRTLRNKPVVSKVNTTTSSSSSPSSDITALIDMVKELVLMNKANQQASMKAVKENCVTCGGLHPYYECLATESNIFNAFAAMGTYNQGGDKVQTTRLESTVHVQPPVVQIPILEPDVAVKPKPSIRYPSRLNDQKLQEKTNSQMVKFHQISQILHFDLSFVDALLHIPKLESCMALANLGASISIMSLFVWKKLSLPDLTSTRMTLNLATRSYAYPAGIAEDVFVQGGKFTFPVDFVVVDYNFNPRVPLILGRPFLRTVGNGY
nr:hypothetical protein [Tanacetum cinerariifolium]GEY65275.1 hypothetical protein [Tanacetum cinerariifolium]